MVIKVIKNYVNRKFSTLLRFRNSNMVLLGMLKFTIISEEVKLKTKPKKLN
jgi:hypothetical protein